MRTCDVVVVGGGMAGVSVAFELAEGRRVVLLEREAQLAHHTTGRSAATYLQSYGNDVVRSLTVASADELAPFLSPRGMLWVADETAAHLIDGLVAEQAGVLEPLGVVAARRLCPALAAPPLRAAALDHSASDIDVAALHQHFVRGLRARGGEIVTSAGVERLERVGDGWSVSASGSTTLQARLVVNAAGAWCDDVARLAGATPTGLVPYRRTLFTSPVAWEGSIAAWPLVAEVTERFYFKPEGDQVLVSPADETPMAPCDVRHEPADVARAIEAVNEFTTLGLRSVRRAWAGLRSFVPDRTPVVGERAGEPGFFWFAGQGGYGIQLAPALARAAADLLDGRLDAGLAARLSPDRPATSPS